MPLQPRDYADFFQGLQSRIIAGLEELEAEYCAQTQVSVTKFERTSWQRTDTHHPETENADSGGGTMGVLRGKLFQKAGVNFSEVFGHFSPKFRNEIPGAGEDGKFWASGVSLVVHPRSPWVPVIHMNIRAMITQKQWFGGGIDLTPALPDDHDTQEFHEKLRVCCDRFNPNYYPRYKEHCDTYFYLPHRQEKRGVGGIFVDNLASDDLEADWAFIRAIGDQFLDCYAPIVRRHWQRPYSEDELDAQWLKRSRYVEFNLLFDRGTRFGIMTGGNTEAILMSLPPETGWR